MAITTETAVRPNVSFLIKPASFDCNLFCDYCFYRKTAEEYPETTVHRLTDEIYETLVKSAQIPERRAISYMWQGGEPMIMGIDFYRRALALQEKHRLPHHSIANTIQTNAIMIDDEWAELFAAHNFLVGVSLDGPRDLHDLHRFTRAKTGVFDKVIAATEALERAGVDYNILSVVNNDTVKYPRDIYRFLVDGGFHYLQFIPCVETVEGELAPFTVKPDDYGEFLCRLFDEWLEDGYPSVSIRMFDNLLQYHAGYKPECCMYKDACGEYLVMEYNGDIYTCDFFVTSEWHLGNIMQDTPDEIMKTQKYNIFAKLRQNPHDDCEACEWLGFCQRGCIKFRYQPTQDYHARSYLCESYRRFLDYSRDAYRFLSWDIMRRHRGEPAPPEPGRNDPCYCGSGKKYKKCCAPYAHILRR